MQYFTLSEGYVALIRGFNKGESPRLYEYGQTEDDNSRSPFDVARSTGVRCVPAGQMRFRLNEVNQFRTIGTGGQEKLGREGVGVRVHSRPTSGYICA